MSSGSRGAEEERGIIDIQQVMLILLCTYIDNIIDLMNYDYDVINKL